jgi:hypothetical protein
MSTWRRAALLGLALGGLAGCGRRMDMYDQPKYKGLRSSTFFQDGRSARTLPEGTVARGYLRQDRHYYYGRTDDTTFARSFPLPVTRATLERGRDRFNIYCTPCHDYLGTGRGMVVRRGFKQPPTYHQDRLREAPVGYLYDVITNGFATMSGYAAQVPVEDRWAIVAYIRTLQVSQNVKFADLSPSERAQVEAAGQAPAPEAAPGGHSGAHDGSGGGRQHSGGGR